MRVTLRVKPGASRTAVGGSYREALIVAVTARAVDGQATEAALRAVAAAFGVPRRDVVLVTGRASRGKVVDIDGPGDDLARRLAVLLAALPARP